MTIRRTAGLLRELLANRDRLTETELIAFREMLATVTQGRRLTERQEAWARRVLERVPA